MCIANYKQDKFLKEALDSIAMQTYKDIEVKIYDDKEGVGSGEAFNRAIALATGDIVVLLCADDIFTDPNVISDIVNIFETYIQVFHVSRWYYQFVDGDKRPVRAWRGENEIELANNPSGLAFRRSAIEGLKLTNKMFIEAPYLVSEIKKKQISYQGYFYIHILKYDTVAVRVHKSTARSKDYYKKMWTSSPVEEWAKLGWRSSDYSSLIQIGSYFTKKGVINEAKNFVYLNVFCLFNPYFIAMFIISLITPCRILSKVPDIYRATLGKWTTQEVKREE